LAFKAPQAINPVFICAHLRLSADNFFETPPAYLADEIGIHDARTTNVFHAQRRQSITN